MDRAEAALKQLDVPPKNVELTVYLVAGTSQGSVGTPLPASLTALLKQLKAEFPAPDYRLVDSLMIRARDGHEAEASGAIGNSGTAKTIFQFKARAIDLVADGKNPLIRIDKLSCGLRIPSGPPDKIQYVDIGANSNIDLHAGQSVLAGKSSAEGSAGAMFFILSAKVVD
jgi:hypothetical protein